jgi:hypothetical protein
MRAAAEIAIIVSFIQFSSDQPHSTNELKPSVPWTNVHRILELTALKAPCVLELGPEVTRLSWDLLILKILALRPDGKASSAEITSDLAILSSANLKRRDVKGGIFQTGYVTFPSKGIWQITDEGRAYLEKLSRPIKSDDA